MSKVKDYIQKHHYDLLNNDSEILERWWVTEKANYQALKIQKEEIIEKIKTAFNKNMVLTIYDKDDLIQKIKVL